MWSQTDDITDVVPVAPPHQTPATEITVASEDNTHVRPDLAKAGDQQLQNRPAVLGGIALGGPQVRHQQLIAAEDIQRQKAIVIIVPMEESADLMAINRIIGRIEFQDQFLRGALPAGGNELFDKDPGHTNEASREKQPRI